MGSSDIVRLKPYQYVHVLDNNANVTRVLVGPMTYTRLEHEKVIHSSPQNCVCVPPDHYCIIENPIQRKEDGTPVVDKNGTVKVRLGDQEIRFEQEPFALYPQEVIAKDVTRLDILSPLQALLVRATRNFKDVDDNGKERQVVAGDEWIVRGPCTYKPRVEVEVRSRLNANVVKPNQALKLRAKVAFEDRNGVKRQAGEEWLHESVGAFIPSVEEDIVEVNNARVLTSKLAVHVKARKNFTDKLGKKREAGQRWIVTMEDTEFFMATPNEEVLKTVDLTTVGSRQYCVVQDYVDAAGKQRLGQKQLRKGLASFFLHPGESLEDGRIKDVIVLAADEALVLTASEKFTDEDGTSREAGDRWMLRGPTDYIPPVEAKVVERRRAIPLDVNEGVYIRDLRTGGVRAHIGSTVMLNENEELWNKKLEPLVEGLLQNPRLTARRNNVAAAAKGAKRQEHKVVSCNVPHNALVQVYDYKAKVARVVKGPELVMLMPDEEFTVLSLSGGKPKQADDIKTLCLHLGPDFMTDIITVETSDHARLQLQLSYNWEFEQTADIAERAFSVPDFVGDACKAIASRIRGFVASESFDSFHKNSSTIIRVAVFGQDKDKKLRSTMAFPSNGLKITNIDIHSVDPVDPKTREALTKSVQLAIEITTKSQEASATHSATTQEQEAKGRLERQIIADKALSETERKGLLELEAQNAAIESTGASKAQSKANAEARQIEGETEVSLASKKADASKIMADIELTLARQKQLNELDHREALYQQEITKTRGLADIEAQKFKQVIAAVGKDTIKALASAGPELQAKLLKGLGLQGYLVTDGTNPINLFNTAKGMTAPPTGAPSQ